MFQAIIQTSQTPLPNNLQVKFVFRELAAYYGHSAHITNIISSSALLKEHKDLLAFSINTWFEKDVNIGLHLILESEKYKNSKEKEIQFIRDWVRLFNPATDLRK